AMILNVIFSLTFIRLFDSRGQPPHGGLALANSLATTLEMIGLLVVFSRRLGKLEARVMAASLWRAGVAAVAMGVVVFGWGKLVAASPWIVGVGGAAVGAGIYFALALLLRSPELQLIRRARTNP
ncbi:MAG: polysaccharide biosynthesis C-terminal domain-containing protein, partial [Chloroflexota bacterium]